jgi:hypothetical protein
VSDALWAAVITGGVALVAIVGGVTQTRLNLHHQRKAEDQRRRHERHMRLLDSGVKAAVDFLAAADRTTRARQALDTAQISLDGAKSSDSQTYQHFWAVFAEARASASAAVTDAENAYASIRMLVPSVADQARRYLDFCSSATSYPDESKVDRQRARETVEQASRRVFGGDLPDNWLFAELARRPRWWQLRRRRAEKLGGGMHRQP